MLTPAQRIALYNRDLFSTVIFKAGVGGQFSFVGVRGKSPLVYLSRMYIGNQNAAVQLLLGGVGALIAPGAGVSSFLAAQLRNKYPGSTPANGTTQVFSGAQVAAISTIAGMAFTQEVQLPASNSVPVVPMGFFLGENDDFLIGGTTVNQSVTVQAYGSEYHDADIIGYLQDHEFLARLLKQESLSGL